MNPIRRRDFLLQAAAGAGLAAAPPLRTADAAVSTRPNIVLCMADDQGWGDMGYNGHPDLKTPYFDDMAATSLRFDRFYAAAPVCSPTRGSVLTGRHPNRFGCFTWGHGLRPQEITLAEALRDAGYVTGHFGKWHLGTVYKDSPVNPGASGFDEWLSAFNFFDNDPILSREGTAIPYTGESSMVTVDGAIEFMRRHSAAGRPFFAVVWFGSPHNPHEALDADRAPYANQPEALQHFYGEISGMDRAFGKLRQALKHMGIRDNTILWYCSDNGGLRNVGSTGGRGHKGQIYEGGLRVPAMLEWPACIPGPRATDIPCNTSDIYPTLLDITRVKVENQPPLDGISLMPLLEGAMTERPEPMGFWARPADGIRTPSKEWMEELLAIQQGGGEVTDPEELRFDAAKITPTYPEEAFPGHAAWLDWPWKLHRIEEDGQVPRYELYRLDEDPVESEDLIGREPGRAAELIPALEAWLASVVRSLNGGDYA